MKKITIVFFTILIFLCCTLSCSKKEQQTQQQDFLQLELLDVEATSKNNISQNYTQTWHATNKRILVFFGYNFNTPEIYNPIIEELEKKYGMDKDNDQKIMVYDLENNLCVYLYTFESEVPVRIFDGKCMIDFREMKDYVGE